MSGPETVFDLKHVSKSYGRVEVVRDLTLAVKSHQITGFLGLNGAGKSTTIKMLLGMVIPSSGEALLLGEPLEAKGKSASVRQHVAYVAENKPLLDGMTVEELVRFTSSFYRDWRPDRAKALLRAYELDPKKSVRSLSRGMRTKMSLLLALSRSPKLLILDEPTDGLDPAGIDALLESLVVQCSEGTSVFFSSHHLLEVERIADHVCVLHKGQLALDASMDDLRSACRQIDVVLPDVPDEIALRIDGVEALRIAGRQARIVVSRNAERIVAKAPEMGALSVEVKPVGLREVFFAAVVDQS